MSPMLKLRAVRSIHTLAWAFFASAVILVPVSAWARAWHTTVVLIAIVCVECLILVANGMQCPLTPIAARYTDDRAPNFDIYLPQWLARYNKQIFGTLFLAGLFLSIVLRVGDSL